MPFLQEETLARVCVGRSGGGGGGAGGGGGRIKRRKELVVRPAAARRGGLGTAAGTAAELVERVLMPDVLGAFISVREIIAFRAILHHSPTSPSVCQFVRLPASLSLRRSLFVPAFLSYITCVLLSTVLVLSLSLYPASCSRLVCLSVCSGPNLT